MAGAVVGGTAGSMTQLIVARAIQGLGAGALIPLAMAVIGDLIPPSDRGKWQGLTGAVFGLASILGPLTGGWIADNTDWRWVFFVSLPVGAAGAGRRARHTPHPSAPRPRRRHRLHRRRAARGGRLVRAARDGPRRRAGARRPRRGDRACSPSASPCWRCCAWHERRAESPIVPGLPVPAPDLQRRRGRILRRRRGHVRGDHVRPAVRPGRARRNRRPMPASYSRR